MLEASGSGKLKDDIIQTIKNITGVIHFLGKENPIALRKQEVSKMFGKLDEVSENGIGFSEPFIVGETVKIIDGPFDNFSGVVDEIYPEKGRLRVKVEIFGRSTPVELDFLQVGKP